MMMSNNLPSPFEVWRLACYFDDKPEVFKLLQLGKLISCRPHHPAMMPAKQPHRLLFSDETGSDGLNQLSVSVLHQTGILRLH